MKLASLYAVAICAVLLVACTVAPTIAAVKGAAAMPAAATGANVDETKAQQVLFVNNQSPSASDSNPGTESQPFLTVSKAARAALTLNQQGIGVRVYIEPGMYREQVSFAESSKNTSAPVIFEGTARGKVILAGSDLWSTGWQ